MIGGLGALIVLAFVFASFLAIVPILMAIVSIITTFLLVWGLTTFTDISLVVQFLVALIGLGVAIDYSLLVVLRWREERAHGAERRRGGRSGRWRRPGAAVVFSGTTVGDRPARARRAAGAVPALDRLRRDADPARQHARRDHAAAGHPRRRSGRGSTGRTRRTERRREPRLDALGRDGRAPPLVGRRAARSPILARAHRPGDRPHARRREPRLAREERRRAGGARPRSSDSGIGSGAPAPPRSSRTVTGPRPASPAT